MCHVGLDLGYVAVHVAWPMWHDTWFLDFRWQSMWNATWIWT